MSDCGGETHHVRDLYWFGATTPCSPPWFLTNFSSSAVMEALRRKKDFVGGTVGGALAGMAYGVSGVFLYV